MLFTDIFNFDFTAISIKAEITISAGLIWTDQLTNNSSLEYKKATAQITTEVLVSLCCFTSVLVS